MRRMPEGYTVGDPVEPENAIVPIQQKENTGENRKDLDYKNIRIIGKVDTKKSERITFMSDFSLFFLDYYIYFFLEKVYNKSMKNNWYDSLSWQSLHGLTRRVHERRRRLWKN